MFCGVIEDLLDLPIDDKPHLLLPGARHVLLELLGAVNRSDLHLRLAHANQADAVWQYSPVFSTLAPLILLAENFETDCNSLNFDV